MRRALICALSACLLLAFSSGTALSAAAQRRPGSARPSTRVLSNERTDTRWANPLRRALIRLAPSERSKAIATVKMHTELGFANVYLLLAQWTSRSGHTWVHLRVPGRPNGRTGWVPRSALGVYHVTYRELVVDRAQAELRLYNHGHLIWHAPIGTGKPSTPTPAGHFWIREEFRVAPGNPSYGPYAFGTSDYSVLADWPDGGVIGIHGTDEPWLIPGHPSHGCIRLLNADVSWLAQDGRLPIGTPVLVR